MTGIAKITKENADGSVQIKELNAYEIMELLARVQDLERELAQAKEQLAAREAKLLKVASALGELCRLKAYKDDHGKTELYEVEQPIAWAAANQVLSDNAGELDCLREHEAKVLEEAAGELSKPMGRYQGFESAAADDLRRMAQERRNHGRNQI